MLLAVSHDDPQFIGIRIDAMFPPIHWTAVEYRHIS
jgi:hypothetical protein